MLRVVAKLHRTVNAVRTNAEFPWMTMARALTRFAACALAFIFFSLLPSSFFWSELQVQRVALNSLISLLLNDIAQMSSIVLRHR